MRVLFYQLSKRKYKSKDRGCIELPKSVSLSDLEFKQMPLLEAGKYQENKQEDDVLKFSRPLNFLKWRFFKKPRYYFYSLNKNFTNPTVYFVLKAVKWQGLNFLILVDYMVPLKNDKIFKSILDASKKIAKKLKFDGIITMSSYIFFDRLLKRSFFMKIGKPHEVLTNAPVDLSEEKIRKRDFAYITMADSDLEFGF